MKTIKAILFDLDGVLVDACDWHYLSLNRSLEEVVGKDPLQMVYIGDKNE